MSTSQPGAIHIAVLRGDEAPALYVFYRAPLRIGRLGDCDITISDDTAVSGHHATLEWQEAGWQLRDMGSKNGTFITRPGGLERVERSMPLGADEMISIGRTRLHVRSAERPQSQDSTPAVLSIDIEDDHLAFSMGSDGAYGMVYRQPLVASDIDQISDRFRQLLAAMEQRLNAEHGADASELHRLGEQLTGVLVPKRIVKEIESRNSEHLLLRVHPHLVDVPWELLLIEDQPVCLRHSTGRQVILRDVRSSTMPPAESNSQRRVLIISNPTGDLPEQQSEAEALLQLLEDADLGISVALVAGARVERMDLLRRLQHSDLVYYVGHAEYDAAEPSNSAWLLQDGRVTCGDFRKLSPAPRLVFANACWSGRDARWTMGSGLQHGGYGLASAFILAGVAHYLGAVSCVNAGQSGPFGHAVFSRLLLGRSIGGGVREARQSLRVATAGSTLTWANYVLYGQPAAHVL